MGIWFVLLRFVAFFLHLAASRFVCQWNVEAPKAFYFLIRPSPGVRRLGICCYSPVKEFLFSRVCVTFSRWALARCHGFLSSSSSFFICAGSRLTHLVTCTWIRVKANLENGSLWPVKRATNRSTCSACRSGTAAGWMEKKRAGLLRSCCCHSSVVNAQSYVYLVRSDERKRRHTRERERNAESQLSPPRAFYFYFFFSSS